MMSGFSRPAQTERSFQGFVLDGSGNSAVAGGVGPSPVAVYQVIAGYTLSLHRLSVTVDGYDFGSPFVGAAGSYLEIQRAGRFVDALDLTLGIPAVFSYGSDAPDF